jgi:hypothetical protein
MMAESSWGLLRIEFDFNSCLRPNDISNLVNNLLADSLLGKFALYANRCQLENLECDGSGVTKIVDGSAVLVAFPICEDCRIV